MPFFQIQLELDAADVPAAEDVLLEHGALSVTLQDPGGEPVLEPEPGENPLWERPLLLALFDQHAVITEVRHALSELLGDAAVLVRDVEEVPDRAWERVWMDDFTPMRFGQRLWICPSTHRVDAEGAIVVHLDPGLAFGTGTHPSTALCLRWLDSQDLAGKSMVDYGCGSGILSVAGLLLGARRCHGVDTDRQALLASRENAIRNDVGERLSLSLPGRPPAAADVLVANILSGILLELAAVLGSLVRPGGLIALSGILRAQVREIEAAYGKAFRLREPVYDGDWALVSGYRRR